MSRLNVPSLDAPGHERSRGLESTLATDESRSLCDTASLLAVEGFPVELLVVVALNPLAQVLVGCG